MNEEMMKSLASLIDESLAELEELKKSDRFSASEIKLDGPGSGIAGKDPNGSMGKDEDKEDDEEDEDEDEEDTAEKAEGKNREADPNGGHHQVAKGEMSAGSPDGANQGSAAGKNREADPNGGQHKIVKAEDKKEDDEDKKKDKEDMKKSLEEQSTLLKSYVDSKFASFETQLEKIAKLVQDIADAPVPSKSVSYKSIIPLKKSVDAGEGEALTKGALVDKLFELKKSGTRVDSVDIASAELASGHELVKIANKYNIK